MSYVKETYVSLKYNKKKKNEKDFKNKSTFDMNDRKE